MNLLPADGAVFTQTCPHPLEQHRSPNLQYESFEHACTHIPTSSLLSFGQEPSLFFPTTHVDHISEAYVELSKFYISKFYKSHNVFYIQFF